MNYEQKYKEALKVMKSLYNIVRYQSSSDALLTSQTIEKAFPELHESEDDRIRKEIIQSIKDNMCVIHKEKCLSWLEKQGEQKTEIEYIYPKFRIGDVIEPIKPNGNSKPVRVLSISKKTKSYCCESDDHNVYSSIPIRCENEYKLVEQKPAWSEEDEERIEFLIAMCDDEQAECVNNSTMYRECTETKDWLKSLKDRVQPQLKQEWCEKDESMLTRCIGILGKCYMGELPTKVEEELEWLKSIKPNHWKPSEEQMEALNSVRYLNPALDSLYLKLKES